MNVVKALRSKGAATVVALVATTALLAPTASAEGHWTSSFSGIVPGFDTRGWDDSNNDATVTKLSIWSCRQDSGNAFGSLRWALIYNNVWTPDEDHGEKTVYCKNYGVTSWGDMKPGRWHFTYRSANGGQDYYFSSPTIRVDY